MYRYLHHDTVKYEACIKAMEIFEYYQFSKEYHAILDESIKIDPTFAYSYMKKSQAYLKSGDFITWKKYMDKAVALDPRDNLDYRGLMRFRCFRDYEGAIKDYERYDSLGFEAGHLDMARALCYKAIGQTQKAIKILEVPMNREDYYPGLYDYLHLGVMYLELEEYEKALEAFLKQSEENEIADNQYYLALTRKALKRDNINQLKKAKELYIKDKKLHQGYINPMHKIYMEDINREMKVAIKLLGD
jgi:tetratricopeptide (TPR) repeat protein